MIIVAWYNLQNEAWPRSGLPSIGISAVSNPNERKRFQYGGKELVAETVKEMKHPTDAH
jgi:hypothetical protein